MRRNASALDASGRFKQDTRHLKVVRFSDNMREVAVTDGDKVAAQIKFGFSVNTAVGDWCRSSMIGDGDVGALVDEYTKAATASPQRAGEG